jgi:uncharacterized protein YndB with AHSA1/START domain
MTGHSVTHNTFTIERSYPVAPGRVFAAFADGDAKGRWNMEPGDEPPGSAGGAVEFDFRVGGRERFTFTESDGRKMAYDGLYYDIVPEQRIVYSYALYADDARISVSVATIEFAKDAEGTTLTWTEQGAYLDGLDQPADRAGGTGWLMDNLGEFLSTPDAG